MEAGDVMTSSVEIPRENRPFISKEVIDSSTTLIADDRGEDDDESYIEIALEPTRSRRFDCDDGGRKELPVSFSSICSIDAHIKTPMTEKINRNAVTKLLVKVGSGNIVRTVLDAFTRPQRIFHGQFHRGNEKQKKSENILRSYTDNIMKLFEGSCLDQHCIDKSGRDTRAIRRLRPSEERSTRVLEVYVDGIRGALQSMSMRICRKDRRTAGCTGSTENSPIHIGYLAHQSEMNSIDSSIKAAIAYCKSSQGHRYES